MFLRKYNTLTVTGTTAIRIPIIKRGVVDFAVSADWTPASGDVKIAIDGAAATNVTNLPTAVAMGNTAYWEFVLTAAELTCKSAVITVADSATKAVEDQSFIVETFGHASAMYPPDFTDAVRLGLTALPNAAADAAGGLPISDAGGLDLDSKLANTNEVTAARMGALTDWINGGRLDLILDIIAADTTTDIPALIAALNNLSSAQVTAAVPTTAQIAAAVDVALINTGDGADLLQAIANQIAADWVAGDASPLAVAAAVRTNLATELARIDAAVSTRASQTSVDDVPTNAELATALAAADDAILAAVAAEAVKTSAIKSVTDKVDTGLVLDGAVWQFTVNMLELAPSGGGGSAPSVADIRAGLFHADDLANRLRVSAAGAVVLDTAVETQIDNIENGVAYSLAVLAGACADPQTASETYAITVFGSTFTVDMAGQTSTGTRTAPTLTKT